jgi:two-component system NtrC family sensor kinase
MRLDVLIVDDSITVRMDLKEAFEAAGFAAALASTLGEAREALATRGPFAVLVLDVLLPDGDGVDLLGEVRRNAALTNMAILLLSTEVEVRDRIRGLRTGADDYVGKPYDRAYLVARARELVRQRTPASPAVVSKTILVIDDSVTFREALRSALEAAGYGVVVAESGEEGLRAAADRRPSAIMVDGVLPGIDGATVIRRVRLDSALRAVPCLLVTGSLGPGAELRALDAGADAFVRKEDEIEVILAKLAAVLRRANAGAAPEAEASSFGPKKILAVDDSPTYLQALGDALRDDGYEVILARSGEEALELLAVESVDCILLDLLMPGLSGHDTCLRIKAAPGIRNVPLIILTALEDREAMIDGLSVGADDYISKSGDFQILKARMRAQIRRRQFEDEIRNAREELLTKELQMAEAHAARDLAETRARLCDELESRNQELEAFSYSVSHDLRAPLRAIDGFSQALLEEHSHALDETGKHYLRRVRASAERMEELIDGLLELSRVGRADLRRERFDLSALAERVLAELGSRDPGRHVETNIQQGLLVDADSQLVRIALDNLLGNAWKFTAKAAHAKILLGAEEQNGNLVYFVRDNGAGFNMMFVAKLFSPFQRLHTVADFPGTGIGLATVRRIVDRHGGRVWAEGVVGEGATLYFTVPPERRGTTFPGGADGGHRS